MAEESPLSPSSETSPLSHKRRITDMVTPHDHHPINNTSQNPTLNLSLLPSEVESSTLELDIAEPQEIHTFPEQSPKKAKFCSLNQSLTADAGCISDNTPQVVEEVLNLDDAKGEFQEKNSETEQLGGEVGGAFSREELKFDVKTEIAELEMGKSDVGFEKNEVVDESSENCSENQSDGVSDTGQFGFEKNAENLDGFLQKLLKKEDSSNSLKIEVIDGTALVDVSLIVDKKNRRRGNNKNGNSRNTASVSGATNGCKKKFVYTRKELEVLKYVNVKAQRKFWQEVYNGFSASVKKDYDEVGSFRHHRNGVSSSDFGGKKNYNDGGILGTCSTVPCYNNRGILGESCSENVSCEAEISSSSSFMHEGHHSGEDLVGEWIEDEESDDEYECIHRPAFKVEGEPDFESGPPEDGLEYLRRVRWEAKQIPKVKIAKLNNIKPKDQSVYMPEIPDIEDCPPHLVPLRQWEDEFIADFSKLRLVSILTIISLSIDS
ncbi:Gem-associated protein 2 [Bienertia sinuspersici]